MREKVKFTEGQPVVVKLDFNDGTQCTSRTGEPQFQYTLDDDLRIMYVDPPVRNYILSEGAIAGDVLRIIKHGADTRAWEVQKIIRPVQGAAAFPPAAAAQPPRTRRANAQQPTPAQEAALGIQPQEPARAPVTSRTAALTAAYVCAIDVAGEAEAYAKKQGMLLKFEAGDIRAMAATIYINQEGK